MDASSFLKVGAWPWGQGVICETVEREALPNAAMTCGRSWSRDITARRAMKRDLYAEVSTRIVAELEAGAAPWVKPWSATACINTPCNAVTNRPYSGCNLLLLWMAQTAGYRTPRFLTLNRLWS